MKSYLDLIPISSKVHKKQTRMTRICIILSVFLVSVIFGMADMEIQSQITIAKRNDGSWHAMFKDITRKQAKMIEERAETKIFSPYAVTNYRLDEDYEMNGTQIAICGINEDFLKLYPAMGIMEGSFPKKKEEALVSQSLKSRLNLNVGSVFTMTMPGGREKEYTISGFTNDNSMLAQWDAFGVFLNMEAYSATFTETTLKDDWVYYVQFKPFTNIQKTLDDICLQLEIPKEKTGQNAKLLALLFQSHDVYLSQLYTVAAVLAILVTIAGILMIASSLNSSIARRTEFFGLLRCLGASPKQVIRFVRSEALSWCKAAIPIGLSMSVIVIWVLGAFLEYISPTYFAEMPDFMISWPGLLSGAAVGFLTVLLAARRPAKRAAAVSPLTAVSGNAGTVQRIKRPAKKHIFKIETALGIHHAKGSKKNLILMTGSFAFSIILFLAFATAIDFMHHAITPLNPYTADISIYSKDESLSVPREVASQLKVQPAVEKVYGRCFSYSVPVKKNGQDTTAMVISYEENQFGWASELMLEGSIEDVQEGNGVLAVFKKNLPVETGDSYIILPGTPKETTIKVSGVVSHCPFDSETGILICSEKVFQQLFGKSDYTIIDLKLTKNATDADADEIRAIAGKDLSFSDKRMKNQEAKGVYYAFSLFLYGFLVIIGLIAVFNIINSISMSVSARMKQFGAMRAIGMSDSQLIRMVSAEALAYGLGGVVVGTAIGLPVNKALFESLVTARWGDTWYIPVPATVVIVLVLCGSVALAVAGPAKRIRNMSIVDTIGSGE